MSKTICFFGATGGVTNACMTHVLKSDDLKAIALVRNPEKLKTQLQTQQGLDDEVIDARLTIVKGNALEITDVKRALLANISSGKDQQLPETIVSGLGGTPHFRFDVWHPFQIAGLDNPVICQTAAAILITALQEIYKETPSLSNSKPAVTFVSTTGITRGPEDVPLLMRFLYHQMLHIPHLDKKEMENAFRDHMLAPQPVFASVTGIRPTLLTGAGVLSEAIDSAQIRAGVESKPETGYTIGRADVGTWVFNNVVNDEQSKWRGEMVSLA